MGKITDKKKMAVVEKDKIKDIPQEQKESDKIAKEAGDNKGYCVKCKAKKDMVDRYEVTLKNKANALQGKCETCGTKMTRILGKGATTATTKKK